MEYVPKHTTENHILMVRSWWFVMAFVIYLWFVCDGSIMFFSAELPRYFYIQCILSNFKGWCWLLGLVFITTKKHCLKTYLIMNVAFLKVTCGRCLHTFPFFSRRRTADVYQLWSSAFSGKHEVWAGRGNGAARLFFWATGIYIYIYILYYNKYNIYYIKKEHIMCIIMCIYEDKG